MRFWRLQNSKLKAKVGHTASIIACFTDSKVCQCPHYCCTCLVENCCCLTICILLHKTFSFLVIPSNVSSPWWSPLPALRVSGPFLSCLCQSGLGTEENVRGSWRKLVLTDTSRLNKDWLKLWSCCLEGNSRGGLNWQFIAHSHLKWQNGSAPVHFQGLQFWW